MRSISVRLLAVAAAALATRTLAADQTILGKTLTIKNPGVATKRKVTCSAGDSHSTNTLVGNPTVSGAVLEVTANGGTPTAQSFPLPQGTTSKGKPFWSATSTGYKYADAKLEHGPVKTLKIQRSAAGKFSITATIVGTTGTLAIVPPNPGTDACVALALTGGDRYSVAFGAGSTLVNGGAIKFVAKKPTAEGVCGAVPTTTTTTTTSSTSTTTTTLAGSCAASNFLDVSGAPGPGGTYSSLKPSLSASCGTSTVTVQSNGIPTYTYQALTPNGLQAKSYTFTFPRYPAVAASTTPVYLLGNVGVTVAGMPLYAVNEGPQPSSDAYGDPIAAAILDQCGSHSAQQGTFHNHKLIVKCLIQSEVSSSQPWDDPDPSPGDPSPIIGYAFDGFPIYGPYECTDQSCTAVQEMRSSWDSTGYQAGTVGCTSSAACASGYCAAVMIGGSQTTACVPKTCVWSNNAYTAKVGSAYLDQCNGHVGPNGDYHYHATATFPYILGCYRGTPTSNGGNGTPPGGTCP